MTDQEFYIKLVKVLKEMDLEPPKTNTTKAKKKSKPKTRKYFGLAVWEWKVTGFIIGFLLIFWGVTIVVNEWQDLEIRDKDKVNNTKRTKISSNTMRTLKSS